MLFTRNNATAKTIAEDKTMFGSGSSVPRGTRRKLMKAAIARLNQARKNLTGFPCTPRSKFARTSLRALAATAMCFSMAFATVAVPAVSDVTAVEAQAASGWAAKTMSCTVTGKAKKIVVKWDKLSGAKKYKVQRKEKGGSWKTLTTVSSSKTKYADTSAKTGKTYFYKVTAYNGKKWTKGTKSEAVSRTSQASASSKATLKDAKAAAREVAKELNPTKSLSAGYTDVTETKKYAKAFYDKCQALGISCEIINDGGWYYNKVTIGGKDYMFEIFMYDFTAEVESMSDSDKKAMEDNFFGY